MKTVAQIITNKINALGFTKEGRAMVVDQAEEVVAALAGCRSAAALRALRKKKGVKDEPEAPLALTPDHPEECEGTDFIMNDGGQGVWIRVDGIDVHICRGSEPRANDGGLRIFVHRHAGLEVDPINELVVFPEDVAEDVAESSPIDAEYCDECNARLEDGQIGKCGDCQDVGASFTNHYLCVCGHHWTDEWSCSVDDECPQCGTDMTPYASDDGSMTEEAIEHLQAKTSQDRKFVVSDGWGHIFAGSSETTVRFVFSQEKNAIVLMQIMKNGGACWVDASRDEIADVEDSLKNANPEFLGNPYAFGDGYAADELSGWAEEASK